MVGGKSPVATFALGFFIGITIFVIAYKNNNAVIIRNIAIHRLKKVLDDSRFIPPPIIHIPETNLTELDKNIDLNDVATELPLFNRKSTDIEDHGDTLFDSVRILCMVITTPKYHKSRAVHVKKTWGRRCNKLVFMSTKEDTVLGAEKLNVKEGYWSLWAKTKRSVEKVYEKYLDEADWFFKADDDTYAIMENLRYLLKDFNSNEAHYFGCNFEFNGPNGTNTKVKYMSGGAGYVMSKKALITLVEKGIPDKTICSQSDNGYEDVDMGKCMVNLGINGGDSRDKFGRYRFLALPPIHHISKGYLPKGFWWWKYIKYPMKEGPECCSDTAVSFHYVKPNEMYLFDFFLYHLRPYGIHGEEIKSTTTTLSTTTVNNYEIEDTSTSINPLADIDLTDSTIQPSIEVLATTLTGEITEDQEIETTDSIATTTSSTTVKPIPKKKKTIKKIDNKKSVKNVL